MADTVRLTIDGRAVEVPRGQTILEAARRLGIHIPTLCYREDLAPIGACRVCVVQVAGHHRPVASCQTVAEDGMVIESDTEELHRIRQDMMRLILVRHPLDCPVCDRCGECELQDRTVELGVAAPEFSAAPVPTPEWRVSPLVTAIASRCIMCGRCVTVCQERQGASSLTYASKAGFATRIVANPDGRECESCGQCVAVCPVGTLLDETSRFRRRPWEMERIATACPGCGIACTLDLNVYRGELQRVTRPETQVPNRGLLCVRGQFGWDFVRSPERITRPLVRRDGELQPASWEEALDFAAQKLAALRERHGADALAAIGGPELANEAAFAFQTFARQILGTRQIVGPDDAAGDALRNALGIGVSPATMDDILGAEVILAFQPAVETDENLAANWILEAVQGGARLLLAGPSRGKLGRFTRRYLASTEGDAGLVARELMRALARQAALDWPSIEALPGGAALRAMLADERSRAPATGLDPEMLHEFARQIPGQRLVVVYVEGEGLPAHLAVRELVNLLAATGNLFGPGRGLVLAGGGGNRRGVRDMGLSGSFLPGGLRVEDAAARRLFQLEGARPIPDRPGLAREEIVAALARGELKGLLAAGADLADLPGWAPGRLAGDELELVVMLDQFLPAGLERVDVFLPAARFAEAAGSVTASSRQVLACRPAIRPAGQARPDTEILSALSERLGGPRLPAEPEALLGAIAAAVPGYRGFTRGAVERGRAWPLGSEPVGDGRIEPAALPAGHPRLVVGQAPDALAQPTQERPFVLQWLRRLDEGGPGGGRSANLAGLKPRPELHLARSDARGLDLAEGAPAAVATAAGRLVLPVAIDDDLAPGHALVQSLSAADRVRLGLARNRPAVAAAVERSAS